MVRTGYLLNLVHCVGVQYYLLGTVQKIFSGFFRVVDLCGAARRVLLIPPKKPPLSFTDQEVSPSDSVPDLRGEGIYISHHIHDRRAYSTQPVERPEPRRWEVSSWVPSQTADGMTSSEAGDVLAPLAFSSRT